MQIGAATAWPATSYGDPSTREAPASAAGERATSGSSADAPEERRSGEILAEAAHSGSADPSRLPPEEQAEVAELKRRDQEVRQHEGAHMSAGGGHVRGGASYSYQTGPDGNRYAVGGEVSIDASPVADNPAATIAKMQTVRRAALAPANPSGQDLAVAARASQVEMQARMQAAEQAMAPVRGEGKESPGNSPSVREGDGPSGQAPSSPADAVGPVPVTTGTHLDAYA